VIRSRLELRDTPDAELISVLRTLQEAILVHPVAAQTVFYALVREGRAFAETPEGAALREQLAHSEMVIRGRVLWDALTVRALEDDPDTVLPTAMVEAMVKAATSPGMEHMLEDVFLTSLQGEP